MVSYFLFEFLILLTHFNIEILILNLKMEFISLSLVEIFSPSKELWKFLKSFHNLKVDHVVTSKLYLRLLLSVTHTDNMEWFCFHNLCKSQLSYKIF